MKLLLVALLLAPLVVAAEAPADVVETIKAAKKSAQPWFREIDDLDLAEEFANMFTLGSESKSTAGSKMQFSYMTFGIVVAGIFFFGALTAMLWRTYSKRGGSVGNLIKLVCAVLSCRVCKKSSSTELEDAELDEPLLGGESDYDEEEGSTHGSDKKGKPMSLFDMEELEGQKSTVELFLDLQVEGSQQEYDSLKKLYSIFAADGFDEYDMGKLLRSHKFALFNVAAESSVNLNFDEDEYEAKLERYADAVFPRVVAQLGTWKELTDDDVTSRMHPESEGEHDVYTSDDTTKRMLKDMRKCYTWDYCLVFKIGDEDKQVKIETRAPPKDGHAGTAQKTTHVYTEKEYFSRATAHIIGALIYAQLRVALYYSVQRDEIYCLVGASEERLIKQAEQMELELILNPKKLAERAHKMKLPLADPEHKEKDVPKTVWDNIYGTFKNFKARKDARHELYQRFDEGAFHPDTVFRTVDRLKLTNAIISDELVLGGASLPLRKFAQEKGHPLLSFYPLDETMEKENLKQIAYPIKNFWNPPLEDFRDYFGEQIAMYFAFLASYTRWLIVPAVVGLGFFVWQIVAGTVDVPGIGAYGVLVAIWASLFLENWRRIESVLRAKWGMSSADEKENNRPEFDGDWVVSRVTGKLVEHHATVKRIRRAIASNSVLVLFLCVVMASVGSIFMVRKAFAASLSFQLSMTLTAVVNTVQIQIMNFLYGLLATHLNDYENHQTDTQYFNAMITKSFIFKFINCYNTFLYIGFFKKYDSSIGYCHDSFLYNYRKTPAAMQPTVMSFVHNKNTTSAAAAGLKGHGLAAVNSLAHGPDYRGDCMYELAHNLCVIFVSMILVNNFLEVFVPWLHGFLAKRRETKQEAGRETPVLSSAELQNLNDPYESTFGDYEELAVQFGYVVLFVVAFPLTPILALANNIVEYRVDAVKLVELTRRPVPRSAGDIGTWYTVLNIVAWLALVTNLGLVMFASNLTKGKSAAFVLCGFIVAEHVLFLIKTLIAYIYRGDPEHVKEHQARQKFLSAALIGR
mmetsp:Transcript_22794/g.45094  ORF Transcript_22794/g.45094 Transcript_22794/m.45094 type:complete len:1028 (+) Transcript_22794:65-3148(+)